MSDDFCKIAEEKFVSARQVCFSSSSSSSSSPLLLYPIPFSCLLQHCLPLSLLGESLPLTPSLPSHICTRPLPFHHLFPFLFLMLMVVVVLGLLQALTSCQEQQGVTQETFGLWLTLSRLLAASYGEEEVTSERWEQALQLEGTRKQRSSC